MLPSIGGYQCPKCNSYFKEHELLADLPSTCPKCYRVKMETEVFRECQLKPIPVAFPVETPDQKRVALEPIDPTKPVRQRIQRKREPKKDSGDWLAKAVDETRVMPIVKEDETKPTEQHVRIYKTPPQGEPKTPPV